MLQYNYRVPDCLRDSINSFWSTYPKCPNDKYSEYVRKLEGGDTDIDYKEFRESFIESTQFIIASKKKREIDSLGNVMFSNVKDSNYQQIITATKKIFKH